ncbi:MAG: aminotransferase class I/II-fold pyridoxal phosphate-dependent enzyme [Clostridia bacterium]
MKSLWGPLTHYGTSEILPMHMPGHKRKSGFLHGVGRYDITEVRGFDDLHHPQGIIKEAMEDAAALYKSDATWFLVNGSTAGILSAVTAVTRPGDQILLARNCHKSALNAVTLRGLKPVWLLPPSVSELSVFGSIDPKDVEKALTKNPDIAAVLIVSPTYEGIISNVASIAEITHRFGVPLIVDAAHGAHFRFGKDFPADALSRGADLVIESLHKTLPSLTQTAVLHLKSDLVSREKLEFALQAYQSSSPSYLLIASITECLRVMEEQGEELMAEYSDHLNHLRKTIQSFGECFLLDKEETMFDYDKGKIVLGLYGYDGRELAGRLFTESRVETEMAAPGYLVAMTSVYDDKENLFRFAAELSRLRREMPLTGETAFPKMMPALPEQAMLPAEALEKEVFPCPLEEAENRVSAETLYIYPPGSPLVAAGERISEDLLKTVELCRRSGITVHGLKGNHVAVIS